MQSHPTGMRRRAASLAALASVLAVVLVFAAGTSASPSSSKPVAAHPGAATGISAGPTSLTWGLASTIATLNWIKGWGLNIPPALSLSMEGLLKLAPDGSLQPNLAASWKQVTPTLYRYFLRRDVKFWDGTPFTAQDVVATYGYLADVRTGSPLNSMFQAAKYIVARDKYQVDIRLKKPDAFFKFQPAAPAGWITSKSFLEAHYSDMGTPGALIMGTGPYKVTGFRPDQSVSFAANTHYWGKVKPKYKTVTLNEIPDATTRAIAVQSGQIDGAIGLVPGTEEQWQRNGVTTKFGADNYVDLIGMNVSAEPWKDIHIRRMITYAIDRNGLIKSVLGGNVTPANWFALPPSTSWGGLMSVAKLNAAYKTFPPSTTFNMAKAKAELAASSHPDGFNATVFYPDNHPENGALALSLAQNLKTIGVNLTVQKTTYPAWVARVFAHKNLGLEFVYAGYTSYDPTSGINNFTNSAQAHANAFNLPDYLNPAVDANNAIAGDPSKSGEVRATAAIKVLKALSQDLPWVPLWWGKVGIALAKNVSYNGDLIAQSFSTYAWANSVTKK